MVCCKRPVGFDQLLGRDLGCALKSVDVLSEIAEKQALVVEQLDEVVAESRIEFAGVQLLRQGVEGLRIFGKIGDIKDSRRMR